MAMMTVTGIVENGHITLREDVSLPEKTEVLVVIPKKVPTVTVELVVFNKTINGPFVAISIC
jgi:hypothetical protein